jgi:hypothetical protein
MKDAVISQNKESKNFCAFRYASVVLIASTDMVKVCGSFFQKITAALLALFPFIELPQQHS